MKINKKIKIIILSILSIILIISIYFFCVNLNNKKILKNPEKTTNELLNAFYGNKYNKKVVSVLLDKSGNTYFKEIEENLYDKVYESLKEYGEEKIIENENIVTIAKEYSKENLKLLKRIKNFKIQDKVEIEDGYNFTIKITKEDLSDVYTIRNECISKKQNEYPEEKYNLVINYYCSKESLKEKESDKTIDKLITITVKENEKGYYIPTSDSLNTLLSAAM